MSLNKKEKTVVAILVALILVALLVLCGLLAKRKTEKTSDSTPDTVETQAPSSDVNPTHKEDFSVYAIDINPYEAAIFTKEARFLLLVNAQNNIGTTIPCNIVISSNISEYSFAAYSIHETALKALTAMCLEAEASGIYGIDLTSAYRSYEKQSTLFNTYCEREMTKNPMLSRKEAEAIVETYSCRPGTSEHQTGLAVDLRLRGDDRTLLEESFGDTEAGKWLAENCERFGFILRFPKDKTHITGIQYEPWHFRFVGYEAANEMKKLGMCLEEYAAYLDGCEE